MKKFFKRVWGFLTNLFHNIDGFIDRHIEPSIKMVEKLKSLIDSPVADVLVKLTPTGIDDTALSALRYYLTRAITMLQLSTCLDKKKPEEIILCFIQEVKKLSPEMQKGIWLRLASLMAKEKSGRSDVKGVHIDTLVQMHYLQTKDKG
jgi:hypothetical protein